MGDVAAPGRGCGRAKAELGQAVGRFVPDKEAECEAAVRRAERPGRVRPRVLQDL